MLKQVPFEKLSKSKKVVEVAKDVLVLIKMPEIEVEISTGYLRFPSWAMTELNAYGKPLKAFWRSIVNLQPLDESQDKPVCQVCGIGSMLLAYVDKVNAFALYETTTNETGTIRTDLVTKLMEITTQEQLDLIEIAFETKSSYIIASTIVSSYKRDAAIKFGDRYKTPTTRLRKIMKNIIRNKGVFKP